MAVYTEVTDDALTAFLADYDIGSVVAFRGIAEGVENSNYSLRTTSGDFILTLVRTTRRSGGAALVPRPDRASGEARHRLPVAGAWARWSGTAPSVRPACRHHDVPAGRLAAAGAAGALRAGGCGAGGAARRRPRLCADATQCARAARLAAAAGTLARAGRRGAGGPGAGTGTRAERDPGGMAAGTADRPHPCRPVSRQRVLPGRQSCPA